MATHHKLMKAVHYEGYGGGPAALKHIEIPIPTLKKNDVLLKLEATSLNPIDWKIQKGMLRPFMPPKFPYVPGIDVAGEVVEIGPGVTNVNTGDKVVAVLKLPNGGGLAEFAVAPADLTVIRPPELSPDEASGLGTASLTALQALRTIGYKLDGTDKPANILITAASGGVGHFAVQFAKHAGLHVTATCGARNLELVKSLGADEVLDYKTPEGEALRSPSGRMYDSVIQCATGIPWSTFERTLSEDGKVVDVTPSMKATITSVIKKITFSKKRLVTLLVSPNAEDLGLILNLAKDGKVKTVVDSRYPLSSVEEGWAKSMSGHATGKVVVQI